MLVLGTQIRQNQIGNTIPIENVLIGSKVYDPVKNEMVEVIDILAREVLITDPDESLLPVIILRGEFRGMVPSAHTEFSPEQRLLVPHHTSAMKQVIMIDRSAKDISSLRPGVPCKVNYYCLITAEQGYVIANGVIATTHTQESVWG